MASKELKTKPTQNSVKDLRTRGIIPDMLVCRADYDISSELLDKISYMTGVTRSHVIPAPTVPSIYCIPTDYHTHGVGSMILHHLQLDDKTPDMSARETLKGHIYASTTELRIAMVGKYVELEDAYYSLNESLKVA
jgi:CTP synthase